MSGVELLYETPETGNLAIGDDGRATRVSNSPAPAELPTLSGPEPQFKGRSFPGGLGGSEVPRGAPAQPQRPTGPEDLMAMANKMEAEIKATHAARMNQGPSARRLQAGSPDNMFTTELTQGAENAFQNWPGQKDDAGDDYDLRGAFADGTQRSSNWHLPDTYKKPNHETFSNESVYSDHGAPGKWVGEELYEPWQKPPAWLMNHMEPPPSPEELDPDYGPEQPDNGEMLMASLDPVQGRKYGREQDALRQLKADMGR